MVGGSGRQSAVRTLLLGARVSSEVAKLASLPVLLVGRRGTRTTTAETRTEVALLAGTAAAAAAA